jgi:hypothetical protein
MTPAERNELREKVGKAKYEEKRARLLDAFGDTFGWPEWDCLSDTLKEIQMEESDAAIALVRSATLREAAEVLTRMSEDCIYSNLDPTTPLISAKHAIAAILALNENVP